MGRTRQLLSSSMRALLTGTALALSATVASGNPIVITPAFELSGENVTVDVYRSESKITGDYTFRAIQHPKRERERNGHQVERDDGFTNGESRLGFRSSVRIDYTVGIIFPVILPTNGVTFAKLQSEGQGQWQQLIEQSIQQRLDLAKPEGTIDGHDFIPRPGPFDESWSEALRHIQRHFNAGPVTSTESWTEARKGQPELPEGWELVFSHHQEPNDASKNEVKVRISYTQPHLPGNISAYLPILPGNGVKANYLIAFQAQDGTSFSPVANYEVVGLPSATNLSVRPAHLQLLRMQVK